MPEVRIKVDKDTKKVSVVPEEKFESNDMIQEMMLLAGESAAKFAFKNKIPFPYVSQESPSFPDNIPDGWAGEFARVKCMRKRSVGITPSGHAGLGLSFYSQVTSPLRRYSDLVAHQQLRAFIKKNRLLDKDEMLERIAMETSLPTTISILFTGEISILERVPLSFSPAIASTPILITPAKSIIIIR